MGRENGNDAEQTAFPSPESTRINFGQLGRGSLPHARGAIIPIQIQTSMRIGIGIGFGIKSAFVQI